MPYDLEALRKELAEKLAAFNTARHELMDVEQKLKAAEYIFGKKCEDAAQLAAYAFHERAEHQPERPDRH